MKLQNYIIESKLANGVAAPRQRAALLDFLNFAAFCRDAATVNWKFQPLDA